MISLIIYLFIYFCSTLPFCSIYLIGTLYSSLSVFSLIDHSQLFTELVWNVALHYPPYPSLNKYNPCQYLLQLWRIFLLPRLQSIVQMHKLQSGEGYRVFVTRVLQHARPDLHFRALHPGHLCACAEWPVANQPHVSAFRADTACHRLYQILWMPPENATEFVPGRIQFQFGIEKVRSQIGKQSGLSKRLDEKMHGEQFRRVRSHRQ